jgi:hypothetical protein
MVTMDNMTKKVMRWNGMYDGKGGPWVNDKGETIQMAASDCNNFWEIVTEITTQCTGNKTN